jgi:hypothetical protein
MAPFFPQLGIRMLVALNLDHRPPEMLLSSTGGVEL